MLNPERKMFRSSHVAHDLSALYVTILRDRELIGGISRLVQFFHVESNDERRALYTVKTLHGERLFDTIFHDLLLSICQK